MVFSARLPLGSLCALCRMLRHYLHAGLTLRDGITAIGRKGPVGLRPVCSRIAEGLEKGDSLEDALKTEHAVFPPLFVALVAVGEKTGMLAEVFGDLEKFYTRQQKLRRDFVARITWPVIQFFLAVCVIAGLILILGIIASSQGPGTKPFDPLGLGLSGASGASLFLVVVFGTLAGLVAAYIAATRMLRQGIVDAYLLRVPALGPCLRALALTRFSMALRLTMETAMPIAQALKLSLRATGNTAFEAHAKAMQQGVRQGDDLTAVLGRTQLFPELFMTSLSVGEESGQVPEVMRRLADDYHDEAGRRLTALASVAAYGTWFLVAAFIVLAIFRIAMSYINLLG